MKRRAIVSLVLVLLLAILVAGSVSSKGHVPAGKVQVSHKGRMALEIEESSLQDHLDHGDVQLPACDFANIFHKGDDTSNVVSSDFTGVTYADIGFVARNSAEGVTPACPPGTF